ncbi:VOC family protein [Desertihabitans aurantiacus]|uniref:VOC family protein n=1 Tax=Desertihabitans aurantiacus TaxID=2282477 RepID=UPI000DF78DCD|nr:VOC family protein [Desertihabitans aurantiacus]
MTNHTLLPADAVPAGEAVLNPFAILDDAAGWVTFVTEVFDAPEVLEARTPLPDGRLIHAQVQMGTVQLMCADRLDGWPARPALLQVWVRDLDLVLRRAAERGAETVTEPTPFWGGTTLARVLDPWDNLWWLYAPAPGQADPAYDSDVVFSTLDRTLRSLSTGA